MRTDDVLEQIGGALADWSVSVDAMRCGAPPGTPTIPPPTPLDHCVPPGGQVTISALVYDEVVHVFTDEVIDDFTRRYRHLCCVRTTVEPLLIDGAAYRRRQRARRRRRR